MHLIALGSQSPLVVDLIEMTCGTPTAKTTAPKICKGQTSVGGILVMDPFLKKVVGPIPLAAWRVGQVQRMPQIDNHIIT